MVNSKIKVSIGASHLYYICSFTGFLIRQCHSTIIIGINLTLVTAFVVTIVLHLAFPVASQANYVMSTSKPEALAQLDDYIRHLETDFDVLHGENGENLEQITEKLRTILDEEKK